MQIFSGTPVRRFGLKAQHAEVEFSDSNGKSAILTKGNPAFISHLLVRQLPATLSEKYSWR